MIQVKNLSHQFKIGKKKRETIVPVLKNINLEVNKGEIVTIVGKSGSGKSTLLNLISGYIRPTEGNIFINNQNVSELSEGDWAKFRINHLGFIFQSFQLLPSMTAFQNIELPLILKGVSEIARKKQTLDMLEMVGLADYAEFYPSELSGGQQQRISIARALVVKPPIILADEPTGSLDSENEQELLNFIQKLNQDYNITFLIITHDDQVAKIGHRTITIKDGKTQGGRNYEIQR
ncbi:ABC transporter ATP-binding protein [Chengkuizengella sediminis]|uniref:ABC transporter ATP-binding protein n=1 Tax=Chengkuizengella sediminis TaxID=1885917 RepID=UPI0013893DB1|nr:ABC transporter ATP-binding protein [Chengkuizengella sediminis]NDI37217.1 ABC transporter ATP-binding protein [Chengkuizengella sediminis]